MQIPNVVESTATNTLINSIRQPKKGTTYLVTIGFVLILVKFIISTQLLFNYLGDSSTSQEIIDLALYTYLHSVLDALFQGSVLIGLGLIYNRM